jgi:hypothetical protein
MTKEDWENLVSKDKEKWDILKEEVLNNWSKNPNRVEEIFKELFDIAFNEGQQYVWFMRSGFGEAEINNKDLAYTMTISDGESKTFMYKDGKLIEENK